MSDTCLIALFAASYLELWYDHVLFFFPFSHLLWQIQEQF